MRRTVMLGVLWLATAVIAVVVAWQGVAVVGDQVTDERPAPLAASEIEARLAAASTTPPRATNPSSTTTPAASSTTGVSGGSTPVATPPAPPPPTTAVAGETRTFNLQGGTASLRFGPAGVHVVFANPVPGFSVDIEPEHGNGVKVEFESDSHESRVDAWWDGGPVHRIREEPKD